MTMKLAPHRWLCQECNVISFRSGLLRAPSPFDPDDVLTGCPSCRSIGPFDPICDVAKCRASTTCGTPTPTGYRFTCSKHRPEEGKP